MWNIEHRKQNIDNYFELSLFKTLRSDTVKTMVCFIQSQNVQIVITETLKPTTLIKFPGVFVRYQKLRGSFNLDPRLNSIKNRVSNTSLWMLRVGICLCFRSASFTQNLNIVYVRPITVKQSLVYLWAQMSFSSRCFHIADDGEANAFR